MNIEWFTLIINALISLFLSLIVFSLGLRAGKERTDRKVLREKYRSIYAYLRKFRDKIEEGKPLYWRNFKKSVHEPFTPLLQEMMQKGEHVELNSKFFPNVVELEKRCLVYGWNFHKLSLDAGSIVKKVLENNEVKIKEEKYCIKTNVINTDENSTFFEINPTEILQENRFEYVLKRLKNDNVGISFKYLEESRVMYSIYIRQVDIKHLDIDKIMKEIRDLLIEEKNKNDSLKYEHVLVNDLNIVLSKLEKKIKEPYSYWNTIGNAFKDFFNL